MSQPPFFVRVANGPDAVAEFQAMLRDVGEKGAHFLAELAELQNLRKYGDLPRQDLSTMTGLFIRYLHDWAVFYTARQRPFAITVVHVALYRRDGVTDANLFQAAAGEALRRQQKL